jgi:hypothetical protein
MQEPLPDEMFKDEEFNKFQDKDIAFKLKGKGKSPLHCALEVVHAVERAKALTGPQDSVGVLFYNVDVSGQPQLREALLILSYSLILHLRLWRTANDLKLSDVGRCSISL